MGLPACRPTENGFEQFFPDCKANCEDVVVFIKPHLKQHFADASLTGAVPYL